MSTNARTRVKKAPAVMAIVPEIAPGEDEATPEPTAEEAAVAEGEKCSGCKGLGLVRGVGSNAGKPYRTLNGAQQALAGGRAVDCPKCSATGLIGASA